MSNAPPNTRRTGGNIMFRLTMPILGLVLILAAMASAYFRPNAGLATPYAVGGLGILLFLTIFLTWEKGNLLNFLHLGMYCLLVTGSFVLLYMIVRAHPSSWDLTRDKLYSLSDQTANYLKKIPQPIKIVAFVDIDNRAKAQDVLTLYQHTNPAMVKTEVHDLVREKLVASQYDQNVYPGDFYVIREGASEQNKKKKVSLGTALANPESQLTNAIVEVMRDQTTKLCFLAGHGEKTLERDPNAPPDAPDLSLSKLKGILEERAFPCEELNLLQRGNIPEDTAAIVIPGPQKDIFDLERDMLEDYLTNGGKLLVLFDPVREMNADFPNLRGLLAKYGIDTPPNAAVVDVTSYQLNVGALTPLVQEFGKHKILEGVPREAFFMTEARPIAPASPPPSGVTVTELLKTGPSDWAVPMDEVLGGTLRLRPPKSGESVQCLAIAADKPSPKGGKDTRIVAIGDSDLASNAALESVTATFLFQTCNWLAEQEDLISIPPKVVSETPIVLTSSGFVILSFSLGLIVLLVLGGGLGYTVLRRKLG